MFTVLLINLLNNFYFLVKFVILKQTLEKLYLLWVILLFVKINKLHYFANLIKKSILRLRFIFLLWLIWFCIYLSILDMSYICRGHLVWYKVVRLEDRIVYVFKLHLKIFRIIHEVLRFETNITLLNFLHVLSVNVFLISIYANTSFLFWERFSSHFYIFLIHVNRF